MRHIIDEFGTIADFARKTGQPYKRACLWAYRGSIPAKYDVDIVGAAAREGIDLSFEDLAQARAGSVDQSCSPTSGPSQEASNA